MFRKYRFMSLVAAVLFSAIALFGLASTTAFAATTRAEAHTTISSNASRWQQDNVRGCPSDFWSGGNSRDDIKRLQAILDKQGYRGQRGDRLSQDGVLGPDTSFALEQFQQRNHLPVTDNADHQTWQALGECNSR